MHFTIRSENHRDEINQIKAERDTLNEKVKQLKSQRDAVRVNVAPIMTEINTINEKIETLKKNQPHINVREIKKQHEELEFKIATTTMDVHEEKRLIDQVKELEIQLSGSKKIDTQHKKIKELLEHRKTFDAQADVFHKELTDVAKRSQELHAVMMEKVNAMKRDRDEADGLHQAFIKYKETNNQIYDPNPPANRPINRHQSNNARTIPKQKKRRRFTAQGNTKKNANKTKQGANTNKLNALQKRKS